MTHNAQNAGKHTRATSSHRDEQRQSLRRLDTRQAIIGSPYAERATCAGLIVIVDKEGTEAALRRIADLSITPDLFIFPPTHGLFLEIVRCLQEGLTPDLATVQDGLHGLHIEWETSMRENVSAANLPANVKQLKDYRLQRIEQEGRDKLNEAIQAKKGLSDIGALVDQLRTSPELKTNPILPPPFAGITEEELTTARLTPKCIAENYLYADLALVCAAGGTGKTTLMIYEAICIATGRDLWGHRILHPGASLIITAEDSRELFLARMREVMRAMNLDNDERRFCLSQITVWDVSGNVARLAEMDNSGNIQLTALADQIVSTYRHSHLAQILFDPAISFSPGERIINDGEQAVVIACRRIIRGLNCCVRLVHHVGKVNARNGATDQYAGRGGTALPDGCRMVTILAGVSFDPEKLRIDHAPEDFVLEPGDSGFTMTQSKLSYAPSQPQIWIRRQGYGFEHFVEQPHISRDEAGTRNENLVADFLSEELTHGRRYTKNALEQLAKDKLGISRNDLRSALAAMSVSGRVVERDLPPDEQLGNRKKYLHPLR